MAKIVISYRRADTEAVTGRIRDRLVGHYGQESVFMDIDSIPFGIDFRDYIKDALDRTDVLIAVMGTQWAGKISNGPSRIMEEADPVRIEVETALARGIAVIPLLVDEAVMPQPSDLPDTLKNLAFRNAAYVDSGRDFHPHMDRLIRSMDRLLGRVEESRTAAPETAPAAAGAPAAMAAMGQRPEQPPQITMMAPTPAKRRWGLWVGIGLATPLVILGLLAIIGLLLPEKTGPQTAETPAAIQPAAQPATSAPSQPAVTPTPVQPPTQPPPILQPAAAPDACNLGNVVAFRDTFNPPAEGWDVPSQVRFFAEGQMVFKLEPSKLVSWMYSSLRFEDVTVCGQLRSPRQANKLDGFAKAGLVFAAADYRSYYTAQIYLDGTFRVYRQLNGEWISVVPKTQSPHIRTGLDVVNELKVTLKGSAGSFFINGQKVTDFRVQPPENGGSIGFYGESEADREAEWRFLNIVVAEGDAPAPRQASAAALRAATTPISCKNEGGAAFADNFSTPDAGWGQMSSEVGYRNGRMMLKVNPGRVRALLYLSLRYTNATVCANFVWPSGLARANDIAGAGVAFWASSYRDYYQTSIYRDGTFDVFRSWYGKWFAVHRRSRADSIKTAPDAVNQVKVHTLNNMATVYINGVQVVQFYGQTPKSGGAVGLYAQADKDRDSEWYFTDIMVVD